MPKHFPLIKEGDAGVSRGVPRACGTAAQCSGLRVLQGLRRFSVVNASIRPKILLNPHLKRRKCFAFPLRGICTANFNILLVK